MSQSLTIVQNLQHYDKMQFTILFILLKNLHIQILCSIIPIYVYTFHIVHCRSRALATVLKIKENKQADAKRTVSICGFMSTGMVHLNNVFTSYKRARLLQHFSSKKSCKINVDLNLLKKKNI